MLLIKKLCRLSGESRRAAAHEEDQHFSDAATLPLDTSLCPNNQRNCQQQQPTTSTATQQSLRRRFAASLNCSSGGERNTTGTSRPTRCRTPPPLYNSLPATPPPSYTPRHIAYINTANQQQSQADEGVQAASEALCVDTEQNDVEHVELECYASAAALPTSIEDRAGPETHTTTDRAQNRSSSTSSTTNGSHTLTLQQEHQQAAPYLQPHNLYHHHQQLLHKQQQLEDQFHRHQENHQQQQAQKRYRFRVRRRLHLLHQPSQHRFPHNIHADSTSSNSNSNSSFSSDSELECLTHGRHRRQLQRDVYCPDLLHACSLILNQQQQQSGDSSVGSFTDTAPSSPTTPPSVAQPADRIHGNVAPSSDYAEIDSLITHRHHHQQQQQHYHRSNPELHAHLYQNDIQWISQQHELCAAAASQATSAAANGEFTCQLDGNLHNQRYQIPEMGQHISLRRPRISLTWVLREQQQQQQNQQTPDNERQEGNGTINKDNNSKVANGNTQQTTNESIHSPNNNNAPLTSEQQQQQAIENQKSQQPLQRTETAPNRLDVNNKLTTTSTTTTTKRYRIKQLPGSTEPLNGYATTPTAHTQHVAIAASTAPQKFFSNQNLLDYKVRNSRAPSKELLFVCTPQRLPKSHSGDVSNDTLALAKRRNEIRKKMANKMAMLQAKNRTGDGAEAPPAATHVSGLENVELKSLKGTYSEPSLIAASEGNHHQRRHRHRKRRERSRVPKFGYEIQNVDEFLTKCSLATPANIPVVLSIASTLYQTRPGGYQMEIPLPLGMVVNAVFKNQNWLYVQTPHAEEGYVMYTCCLPLGILPPAARGNASSTKPTPCWESNGDIFPRPCGNMTDSEKELRMRGGTRSDGARTPCGKRGNNNNGLEDAGNAFNHQNAPQYSENHLDKLYLRAASQPKLVEKAYAQLRSTKAAVAALSVRSQTDEYVTLQHCKAQPQTQHLHKNGAALQQQQKKASILNGGAFVTNGQNGQHLHPSNVTTATSITPSLANGNIPQNILNAVRRPGGLRQTLVAINTDYATESITLHKGEIVTLCECRESKDHRQWFYVKTRDGREGYIPAEVAGHGYL